MTTLNYLNLGCGKKFHDDWVNVDLTSTSPRVIAHNLFDGIPFPDDRFEVVYHSQVLEHFSREKAPAFVRECLRVLAPRGIMRVVVPDLENIATEYLKLLRQNLEKPTRLSEANYDWIMIEMYDQTVRNRSGGLMAAYLRQPDLVNESYVLERIGHLGRKMRRKVAAQAASPPPSTKRRSWARRAAGFALRKTKGLFDSEIRRMGAFRLSGEAHLWMYDRYSLCRLLRQQGFIEVRVMSPFESSIPDWERYELDVKDGAVYDPTSLFMEARKPGGTEGGEENPGY